MRCVCTSRSDHHRHNSTLHTLHFSSNPISVLVRKSVELELVLCRLRNAQVTQMKIDALDAVFDDADVARIAEALRCKILRRCLCGRMSSACGPKTVACVVILRPLCHA